MVFLYDYIKQAKRFREILVSSVCFSYGIASLDIDKVVNGDDMVEFFYDEHKALRCFLVYKDGNLKFYEKNNKNTKANDVEVREVIKRAFFVNE